MKTLVCFKSVYDDAAIRVSSEGEVDYSTAAHIVSTYDLNALEGAEQLTKSNASNSLVALCAGDTKVHDSTMRKNVAARSVDEVYFVMDDVLANAETRQTAAVLAAAIEKIGDVDLVVCGDGSADLFAHQLGMQLGERMGVPHVNAVVALEQIEGGVRATRELDETLEVYELAFPCVISTLPDIGEPRMLQVMDIMKAGSKPVHEWTLEDTGVQLPEPQWEIIEEKAPEPTPRRHIFFEANDEGIQAFIEQIHEYLETEGA